MLATILFSFISLVILILLGWIGPIIIVPTIVIVLASVVSQISREKYLYNDMPRSNEISERMIKYDQYISDVWHILNNHGIYSKEMVMILRAECETALKNREDRFSTINNKIIDMLIGVPLGALIASIIHADKATIPTMIGAVVIIGITFLGIIKLIKTINFYSEGYFKDKYLLDAIDELIYNNSKFPL